MGGWRAGGLDNAPFRRWKANNEVDHYSDRGIERAEECLDKTNLNDRSADEFRNTVLRKWWTSDDEFVNNGNADNNQNESARSSFSVKGESRFCREDDVDA